MEIGAPGPLGDDLFPALQKLGGFTKRHVKSLVPALLVLTTQSTVISDWAPLQYSGLVLALYAAYNAYGEQLGSQDLKRYWILLPALAALGMQYPALVDSTSGQQIAVVLAVYAFYHREQLELQNIKLTPPAILLAVLVAQLGHGPGAWAVAGAFFLMYQGRGADDVPSLPLLVGAVVALPQVWASWEAATQAQKVVVFLAAYVAYHAENDAAATAEALAALKTVSNRVGVYFKVAFVVGVACYVPMHHGLPLHSQVWTHCLAVALVVLVGYFSSPTRFFGPAMYGYTNYGTHFGQVCSALCDWWVYAVFFFLVPACLPFFGFGVMATAAAAWVVVWREYSAALMAIVDKAHTEVTRASLSEQLTREYASAADRYRKQMLEAVALTRRDAFLAESVRTTDFFDCTATAWAALGGVIKPVEDMVKKVEETIQAAERAEDAQDEVGAGGRGGAGDGDDGDDGDDDDDGGDDGFGGGEGGPATELFEAASKAKEKAEDVHGKLTAAQEQIRYSTTAKEQHEVARSQAKSNAEVAVSAAKRLEGKLRGLTNNVSTAMAHAAVVKTLAAQATAVATDGLLESANSYAGRVEGAGDKVLLAMEDAQKVLLEYMGVYTVSQSHGSGSV
ncbi:hypothetical protein DRE_02775 [Drechslerella stenobrocha 248]|uniref:Uncharacterized protein n=1 Tax=Drechslerella stenobrocha 248 TaxID=1043628 RepID=W7I6M7_9PEZI|nr:hypothetical protein DRE_02775 [Drechslerella stenobrocha 248]